MSWALVLGALQPAVDALASAIPASTTLDHEARLRQPLSRHHRTLSWLMVYAGVRAGGTSMRRLGIIMNGVTGRMGLNQHLVRSIVAIRNQGGVVLADGERVMPDPILVGRNGDKVKAIAEQHGIGRWTTDLDAALANRDDTVFFDSATTQMRADLLTRAIARGKHV